MGIENGSISSLVEMFEMPLYSLYPTDDNYITVEGGYYHSPKLLEYLSIDQFGCSLPDLDGDIPPGRHKLCY